MNEKLITELRGRAHILAVEKHYTGRSLDLGDIDKTPDFQIFMDRVHASYELLAELIVKECANAIINDGRLNDVRSAANGCVRTIREHFGVE